MSTDKQGAPWGAASEREETAKREEALASLPPEMRERGAKLLEACEEDLSVWAYTVALMALGAALKEGKGKGEQAEQAAREQAALKLDLVKEVLKFWRVACNMEQVQFVLKELAPKAPDKETLCAAIAYGRVSGTQAMKKHVERIKLLVSALGAS